MLSGEVQRAVPLSVHLRIRSSCSNNRKRRGPCAPSSRLMTDYSPRRSTLGATRDPHIRNTTSLSRHPRSATEPISVCVFAFGRFRFFESMPGHAAMNWSAAASHVILDLRRCNCNALNPQAISRPPHPPACIGRYVPNGSSPPSTDLLLPNPRGFSCERSSVPDRSYR
jgi:hypothetical protein